MSFSRFARVLSLLVPIVPGFAIAADPAQLSALRAALERRETAGAAAAIDRLLAQSPDDPEVLSLAALREFRLGQPNLARGRLERLARAPGIRIADLELLAIVTQAQGDRARRDEVLDRLRFEIGPLPRPRIPGKSDIERDRIAVPGGEIRVLEYFQRNGLDFIRYLFSPGDPWANPHLGLLLRTDLLTTQNWQGTALLADDKPLFHLDLVERGDDGTLTTSVYKYFVGEPDYDTVRAKVMDILRGDAKPETGPPGKLAGILKR